MRYVPYLERLCNALNADDADFLQRHLCASVAILRLEANICVHVQWDVLAVTAIPGSRRHIPRSYTLPRPGVLVSVPANPLEAPIVFIAQRLDGIQLRVSLI